MVCVECGVSYPKRCQSGSRARCGFCSEIKAGDIAAIARSGWTDKPIDRAFMLTLTAPGFTWDRSQCTHDGGRCSGARGCKSDPDALARWHAQLARNWSDFITYLRRALPGCRVEYMKTYEPQKRDAQHVHAPMSVEGVVTEKRLRQVIAECAERWGFGPQLDVSMVDTKRVGLGECSEGVARAAGYVAKYVTKSCDRMLTGIRMIDADGTERMGRLRAWSASRGWGDTMKRCAERRAQWMAAEALSAAGMAPAPAGGAPCAGAAGALTCNANVPQLADIGPPEIERFFAG